ncbi:hypothetical protein, partial [Hymenobacter glacialis]|uniref:hypothetical protein n=1 Tax=Hymenobacter glacialis TaxID=1908236 RepID=UPI00114CACF6
MNSLFLSLFFKAPRTSSIYRRAVLMLLGAVMLFSATAQAQNTYNWVGAPGANWAAPSSWKGFTVLNQLIVSRATPTATDILIFDGMSASVNMGAEEALVGNSYNAGKLRFINGANVTFNVTTSNNTATVRNINIGGGPSDGLVVAAGSSLSVLGTGADGNSSSANLNIILSGTTATIAGAVTFTGIGGSNATITHKIQGPAGSINFVNGGSLTTTGDKLVGTPFGTTANTATFFTGSTLRQEAGDDPYGPAAFISGSTYRYVAGNFGSFAAARTYGNLDFANAGSKTISGAVALTVLNDLTISGATSITSTLNNSTTIGGNLSIAQNASLAFSPTGTTNRSLVFNGSSPQTIVGPGSLNFNENAILEVNNGSVSGLTLSVPLAITEAIRFTAGLLNTTSANPLSVLVSTRMI